MIRLLNICVAHRYSLSGYISKQRDERLQNPEKAQGNLKFVNQLHALNCTTEPNMPKYLISFIILTFLLSNAAASDQFVCKTSKHTVTVKLLPSGKYQYKAWNKPKNVNEKPDMVIAGGEEMVEGTGVCRYIRWEFTQGNVQYIVSRPVTCTEAIPPPNATGQLSVFINGDHKKSWWCLE